MKLILKYVDKLFLLDGLSIYFFIFRFWGEVIFHKELKKNLHSEAGRFIWVANDKKII